MMYAVDSSGKRIETAPGLTGACPGCGKDLIAKCGEINVWHWSHKSKKDCDAWFESETRWHMWWKRQVKEEFSEVVLPPHRADIAVKGRMTSRLVIELQHSTITPETIRDRESFYGNMIWLFDASSFAENLLFYAKFKNDPKREWEADQENEYDSDKKAVIDNYREADYFTFRWKHPRKSVFEARRSVFFDLSDVPYYHDHPLIFHVKKMHPEVPCGGWGRFLTRKQFIETWIPQDARTELCQPSHA